jgi:hypothetical protein
VQCARTLHLVFSIAIVCCNLDCYIFIQAVQLEIKIRQTMAIGAPDFIAEPSAETSSIRLYQPAEAPFALKSPRKGISGLILKVGTLDAVCAVRYGPHFINNVEVSQWGFRILWHCPCIPGRRVNNSKRTATWICPPSHPSTVPTSSATWSRTHFSIFS